MDERAIVKVLIHGKVQGVGFRFWIEGRCLAAGLEGWVRNLRSGEVEGVFAGRPDDVERMVESCRQGPSKAQVTGFDAAPCSEDELALRAPGVGFDVLPTA